MTPSGAEKPNDSAATRAAGGSAGNPSDSAESGPSTGREAATRARKQSVLAAALQCFSELGVEGTTIHQIQRRAGCSIGSIYHHFGSREGIAEELFLDGIQRLNRGMLKKIRATDNARDGVHAVVDYYCEWSTRNQDMARYLHSRDIDFSEEARARLHHIHRTYITAIFTWFAPFVERGEMRVLPAETYVPLIQLGRGAEVFGPQ